MPTHRIASRYKRAIHPPPDPEGVTDNSPVVAPATPGSPHHQKPRSRDGLGAANRSFDRVTTNLFEPAAVEFDADGDVARITVEYKGRTEEEWRYDDY